MLSYNGSVWLATAIGIAFCGFGMLASVPRIAKSTGYTTGHSSVAKVNSAQAGVLLSLYVKDHTIVKRGQIVGEITSERFTQNRSLDADQAVLAAHKTSLGKTELSNVNSNEKISLKATQLKIESATLELASVVQELGLSQQRLEDLARQLERQKNLQLQGFVSTEAVEQRRSEWLQQKLSLSALERNRLQLEREVATQQEELLLIASRTQSLRAQLWRDMATSEQEFNEHSSKRIQLIAPIDGVVTQISVAAGQTVRPDLPIMTIVPQGSAAEVLLLIPSRSIGFIRIGQKVSVRYQAYPYEHYGRHYGVVKEIASAALPPQEVVQHIRVEEPVYTVRVSLPSNYLEYQGKQLPLTPGMVVEADVELDRLKIYQWLLEPLYRLGGRV
jgi:membrane fusion protein